MIADGRCTCGRNDCHTPGKHPRTKNGLRDATTDVQEIQNWWSQWPNANIGVRTGAQSGIVVIDIDPRHGGDDALAELEARYGQVQSTVESITGGGGRHLIYKHPGQPVHNSAGSVGPGIDVRGDGGYFLAPPSAHISGNKYVWEASSHPDDIEIPPLPSWLVQELSKPESSRSSNSTGWVEEAIRGVPEGMRDITCIKLAGYLIGAGISPSVATDFISTTFGMRSDPPFPRNEIEKKVASAVRMDERRKEGAFFDSSFNSMYPLDVLPPLAKGFVEQQAKALGAAPDFIATPFLAMVGAVIGNTVCLKIKEGWLEYPFIWAVVVGEPASAKSPALEAALSPLMALQSEAVNRFKREMKDWKNISRAQNESPSLIPKPSPEHYLSTDTTPEAIGPMLESSPGLLLLRDEVSGWVMGFDNYRRGGERQQHIQMWSGTLIKIDRKKEESVYVDNPVVCLVGGIQPDLIPSLAKDVKIRDGFVERFLWSYPKRSALRWTTYEPDPRLMERVLELLRHLRNPRDEPVVLVLSPGARDVWGRWYDEMMKQAHSRGGLTGGVQAKLPRQVARIAIVLHCLADGSLKESEISADTLRSAMEICDYHLIHAQRALHQHEQRDQRFGDSTLQAKVFDVLEKHWPAWTSTTEMHADLGNNVTGAELNAVLQDAFEAGLVENQKVSTGGRHRRQYRMIKDGVPEEN